MSAPQSSNAWLPGVLLLALAAISYLVHEGAYQTSRPTERGTRSQALTSTTEVEARLWQDPLHAIDEHFKAEEAAANKARNAQHHDAHELKHKLDDYLKQRASTHQSAPHDAAVEFDAKAPADLTVLAVMVPDAPYAEPTERRRRIRYAVLSGLSRQRLVPQDQEHIFFFRHDKPHDPHAGAAAHAEPVYIAYEFLDRTAPRHNPDNLPSGGAALLLWIPAEASQRCPLSLLNGVLGEVAPDAKPARVRYAVMGPPESGTLLEMVRETLHPERCPAQTAGSKHNRHAHGSLPLEIYSPWASAASPELAYSLQGDLAGVALRPEEKTAGTLANAIQRCLLRTEGPRETPRAASPDCDVEEILKQRLRFVRMIADDSLLANALLDELALRGVDPACAAHGVPDSDNCFGGSANGHRIAIVSEWDAPYQRALRLTLARTLRERCRQRFHDDARCDAADPAKGFDWLMRFSYLRGVDGRIADGSDPQAAAAAKPHASDPAHPLGEIETVERAEGNAQFDYVRRLTARIEDRDRELQRQGLSGIGAIGVLGTDPYDKLVILQALHARFPDKLFFTSNLDARLTHPQEAAWARNLIVVSDFDLTLAPGLQRDIPPLRDAYQTAALFATHLIFRELPFRQKAPEIHAMRCQSRQALGMGQCHDGTQHPVRPWFVPLVFEIGRTEAIRLPSAADLGVRRASSCEGKPELGCLEVHPLLEPAYGAIPENLRIVCALAVGIALAFTGLVVAYSAKPRTPRSGKDARART